MKLKVKVFTLLLLTACGRDTVVSCITQPAPEPSPTPYVVIHLCTDRQAPGLEQYLVVGDGVVYADKPDGRGQTARIRLAPGDYVTSDGRGCRFNISEVFGGLP